MAFSSIDITNNMDFLERFCAKMIHHFSKSPLKLTEWALYYIVSRTCIYREDCLLRKMDVKIWLKKTHADFCKKYP